MKVSVIIPVYNVEKYVADCLESVVSQTYKNLEIIVVDDGSTDRSGQICDEYANKDNRIKVIHKENAGLVSARKTGVRCATGDYVSYVDSDDWLDLDMYKTLVEKISGIDVDVVAFNHVREYEKESILRKDYFKEGVYSRVQFQKHLEEYYMKETSFMTYPIYISLCTKLIRRKLIQEMQEQVDDKICMGEDVVSYACIAASDVIMCLNVAPYHYRIRKGSIINKRKKDEYNQLRILVPYIKSIIEKMPILESLFIKYIYVTLLIIGDWKTLYCEDHEIINILPNLKSDSRVFVYGKGNVGKAIHDVLEKSNLYTILDWIDSKDVGKLELFTKDEYDYVIIATCVATIAQVAEKNLIDMKIQREQIIKIKPQDLLRENLPNDIKAILNS